MTSTKRTEEISQSLPIPEYKMGWIIGTFLSVMYIQFLVHPCQIRQLYRELKYHITI
jgi:hypothetical protein